MTVVARPRAIGPAGAVERTAGPEVRTRTTSLPTGHHDPRFPPPLVESGNPATSNSACPAAGCDVSGSVPTVA